MILLAAGLALPVLLLCLYHGRGFWAWVLSGALLLGGWAAEGIASLPVFLGVALPFLALAALFGLPALRRALVTRHVMRALGRAFPAMSDTERTALEAGTVWWDAELFGGTPRWRRLLDFRVQPLSERERAFLDGEVEALCALVDDEEVHRRGELSAEAWEFIRERRLMGMIIPERYGGLGFSAQAQSAVITKLSSHCVPLSVTVMVPNSLGPAELLLHYGTDEQKERYLPRLARGQEIPCFALTEPMAGSDAGGMRARGVVERGTYQGREVLGMRLAWDKRYITLAPVATLIGLAFRLYDPDGLLGGAQDLGITCALVPRDTPGVEAGRRHDPLGVPFLNGPTRGSDVFLPLDAIIGGPAMAGQGWRMLMDCLSAGRSISLPANSTGGAQRALRAIGAYATIREQFHLAIGRFEGVEEAVARIAGTVYWLDAMRRTTAGAVDAGEKPAVLSAIAKRWATEAMRDVVDDAMDVQGGAGICRGPRNVLAHAYEAVPIGITVEGANILTRTMIVFGQGAIRCHPYAFREMEAARAGDLAAFDAAFFGHVGFVLRNGLRSLVHGLTGGALAPVPAGGTAGRALRRLTRYSAAFAFTADVCMGTLGGSLKRRERLSGRLADALAWLYIGSAAVKRFVDEGSRREDEPFLRYAVETAAREVEAALAGVVRNLPVRPAAWALAACVFPLGGSARGPSDRLSARVARAVLDGGEARVALTREVHVPRGERGGLATLERALASTVAAEPARAKLRAAVKAGRIARGEEAALVDAALAAGVLAAEEAEALRRAAAEREDAVQVDAFAPEVLGLRWRASDRPDADPAPARSPLRAGG